MDDSNAQDAAIRAISAKLMDGRVPPRTFARGINKSERTVQNYISEGMPADAIGVIVEPAIAWIRARHTRFTKPPSSVEPVGQPPHSSG